MGRPLNKKYFGNRNTGSNSPTDDAIGGEGVASITFGGTNNSTGFTNGSTSQATFSAPTIANGTTATGTIVTYPAGALTNKTTFTAAGTGVSAAGTYTGVVQKSSSAGTGAVFTITKTSGTTYSSTITVTVTTEGSGYATSGTIVIDGASIGGVTTTNDLTLTIGTFVSTTGTIKSITITNPGSGYATAPTITLSTGTKGTLTVTAVLAALDEPAIIAYAYISGSLVEVDIQRQVSSKRYRVNKTGDTDTTMERVGTRMARINYTQVAAGDLGYTADQGVEMNIVATDSAGGTYLVRKLTNHTCTLNPCAIPRLSSSAGTQFSLDGPAAVWTFGTPTLNYSVQIENA